MICNCCGAKINTDKDLHCPYCGSSIAMASVNVKDLDVIKADKPRSLHRNPVPEGPSGTVKVILLSSNNPLSPACGTTYIMNLNEGKYQIQLELLEFDTDYTIRVPYGSYSTYLESFAWDDPNLKKPAVVKKNNKKFTIDASHNVELIINVGTLIKPQTVTVKYV